MFSKIVDQKAEISKSISAVIWLSGRIFDNNDQLMLIYIKNLKNTYRMFADQVVKLSL